MNKIYHYFQQLWSFSSGRILRIPVGKDRFWFWGEVFVWGIALWLCHYRTTALIYGILLGIFLFWSSITDIRWRMVPIFFIGIGIIGFALARFILAKTISLAHIGIELLVILMAGIFINTTYRYFRKRSGWGWGDTAILLLMGSAMGLLPTFMAYIIGVLSAACWSVYLLLRKKGRAKTAIPLVPFLTIGTLIIWMWGEKILLWWNTYLIFG